MYSRMELPTSDVRWNKKPKKKYELSLKKIKNDIRSEQNYQIKRNPIQVPKTCNDTAESGDSQNFRLRLSDSFEVNDTQEDMKLKAAKVTNTEVEEVILISDSSDEGTPEKFSWMNIKSSVSSRGGNKKSPSVPSSVYIIKSSDSEDNDDRHRQGSLKAGNVDVPVEELQRKCSIVYTSDDDISEDESGIGSNKKKNVFYRSKNNENYSRVTPTVSRYFQDSEKKFISSSERFRGNYNNRNNLESENVHCRGNDEENTSPITPIAIRNAQDSGKKLISSSEKFRGHFNDKNQPEIGINNKRDNVFCRSDENEKRNDQDSGKKLISSSERFGGTFNNGNRLDNQSGVSVNKRGNIFNDCNDKENTSRITPTTARNNSEKKLISEKSRGILTANGCNVDTPGSAKTLTETSGRHEEPKRTPVAAKISSRTPASTEPNKKPEEARRTPISAKISGRGIVLTKKDSRDILKAIKSKKIVYESPKIWKKPRGSDESDVEDSESEYSSPEPVKPKENIEARNAIVIAETDSDSDEKVIQGSRVDTSKPYKTHVTRFLEPTVSDLAPSPGLSEKKKLEVAKWLLTNTADSRSDDSVSNISGTQGDSPHSGNSSLERLEQNYETPNNRGKLKKIESTERPMTAPNSTRSAKTVRQTTIDNFVMKSKDGTHSILTPINTASKKRDLINPAVKEATETLGIMDCFDILDDLYGKEWREKADELLPSSEPRKANIPRKNKGVQTERKANPRSKNIARKSSESSSHDEGFDTFVKNIRPNLNSTKKPATTTSRRRCSFIRDSPSSGESGGETTYLTALTNPRISDPKHRITNRATPASVAIQKVRAICDSDTEDENDKGNDYRKQLSFSDDESSSTSEYDPNDEIPPKNREAFRTPTDAFKTSKDKPSKLPVPKARVEKQKSFLESLCATVPLTEAHPDAKKYRQSFKTTKDLLCKHLYQLFNDKVFDNKLPKDMSIEWNVRMRGTAGFCYNKRSIKALGGVTRSSRIVLSTKILDTPDRLRDTLVHEMCHAAAWLVNEVSDGHGPFWKGWASKAMRAFPELPPIRRCHDYQIKTKFTYRCTGCGYSVGRHSKSLDVEKKRCGHCYGKFELLINKVTKSGTVQMQTPTTKQPTGFALFVKENYHSVKKDRKGAAHKEVMQILGQQFSAIKISKKANNSDGNNSDTASKP